MAKTFPRFSELPTELRSRIWRFATPPRLVVERSPPPLPQIGMSPATETTPDIEPTPQVVERLPNITRTNRDAYAAIRPLYREMPDHRRTISDTHKVDPRPVLFNPDADVLALSEVDSLVALTGDFPTNIARVRRVSLHDEISEALTGIYSFGRRRLMHPWGTIIRSLLRLTVMCKKLEKIYWVVEPDGYDVRSREQRKQMLDLVDAIHDLDYVRALARAFDTQDIDTDVGEEVRERWRSLICIRSTAEITVELGIVDPLPSPEFVVEDYTEADLDRPAVIMRDMVGYRDWKSMPMFRTIVFVHNCLGEKKFLIPRQEKVYTMWQGPSQ